MSDFESNCSSEDWQPSDSDESETNDAESPDTKSKHGETDQESQKQKPIVMWMPLEESRKLDFTLFGEILLADGLEEMETVEIYRLFINDELINLMVTETNRLAQQQIGNHKKVYFRVTKWVDTNFQEMENFMGILLIFGLVQMPEIQMYWKRSDIFGVELVKNTMARDRFLLLLKFWFFCNNDLIDKDHRLFKIENFLSMKIAKNSCFRVANWSLTNR